MNKYKKHLTDEDIQVIKNTMRKHNDVKSPVELMAESIVTEQEKELLRLMYFRFTDYEQQKQRADELESLLYTYRENSKSIPDLIEKIQASNKRADELEKRWSELVDVLKKKYEYYKVRVDDESAGPIEQGKWKIAKHELMMVLKIMTDLKRGETE